MVPRYAATSLLLLFLLAGLGSAQQAPSFDKAKEGLREALKRPDIDDRVAGIRALADAKDPRGVDDLLAALRVVEPLIEKKRDEIEKVGKENRDIWKQVDDSIAHQKEQGVKDPKLAAELVNRTVKAAGALQEKLQKLTAEQSMYEATRAALHFGIGRLLANADPGPRSAKILEIVSAAGRAGSSDEKLAFIRILAAIRAPESRDGLIEMARLNQDGTIRSAAVTALGELEDPSAIPSLIEALKDEVWSVKAAAALALANTPSVDSVTGLAEALGKNEGGTGDAIIKALEDVTGVTFFDNATLWAEWAKKEAPDIKAALAELENTEPSIRMTAMNSLAAKGSLAGVRLMLRQEGADPPRDTRAKFKISELAPAESRPANKEEVETRRAAIAKALTSRPKGIRDRVLNTLILEPSARARDVEDAGLQAAYIRAAAAISHPGVLAMIVSAAENVPEKQPDSEDRKGLPKMAEPERVLSPERLAAIAKLQIIATESLGYQNHDDAVFAAARIVKSDKSPKELKTAAIAALERLHREASVQPLIDALLEKGPVADAAAKSLKTLTGADHGADRTAWHNWWHERGKVESGLARKKAEDEAKEGEQQEGDKKGGTSFYGINTRSKRLLYVLDISGSMNEGDLKGQTGGGGQTKIQVAKKELKSSIASLPEDALFDIIVFADGVQIWKPKLVTASKETKAEATKWVDAIKALGATNIFDALEKAFELAGRGTMDKRYNLLVDTILFMSDGQPNRGRIVEPRAIIAEIARMNEFKKVCVHTIGVGKDHDVELMKRIARLNGGTYISRQ